LHLDFSRYSHSLSLQRSQGDLQNQHSHPSAWKVLRVQIVSSSYESNTATVTLGVLPFLQQPAIHISSTFLEKVAWQEKPNLVKSHFHSYQHNLKCACYLICYIPLQPMILGKISSSTTEPPPNPSTDYYFAFHGVTKRYREHNNVVMYSKHMV
jgi:hypothetical protein